MVTIEGVAAHQGLMGVHCIYKGLELYTCISLIPFSVCLVTDFKCLFSKEHT